MSVELSITDGIAHVVLNRPDKLNAIDASMLDALEGCVDTAEAREDIRAVVLSGRGRAFSAGFDLEGDGECDPASVRGRLQRDFDVIMRFWDCSKPTIAAVHGYCLGSSMELSAVCDITLAATDSRFGAPEVRYGSGIVCLVLPWLIGLKNAKELLLTGDNDVDAHRARAMGLVNRLVDPDELLDEAFVLAKRIAGNDALAVQSTKRAINRGAEIAGFRRALQAGLEVDMRIETTETAESREFNKILQEKGLKAALSWRSEKSAGH